MFLRLITFIVLLIPYSIGPLLSRPTADLMATKGYLARSLTFFVFVIFLNLLTNALERFNQIQHKALESNHIKRPSQTPQVLLILLLGGLSLILLNYADRVYQRIYGVLPLLLVLFGLFPLSKVLHRKAAWKLYLPTLLLQQTTIAYTSLVVHYADNPLMYINNGIAALNLSLLLSGFSYFLGPLVLSFSAGCLGSVATLCHTRNQTAQDLQQRLDTATLILLLLPSPLIALLGFQGILPSIFRWAYLGVGPVVLLVSKYRRAGHSLPGFGPMSVYCAALLYLILVGIGGLESNFEHRATKEVVNGETSEQVNGLAQ